MQSLVEWFAVPGSGQRGRICMWQFHDRSGWGTLTQTPLLPVRGEVIRAAFQDTVDDARVVIQETDGRFRSIELLRAADASVPATMRNG